MQEQLLMRRLAQELVLPLVLIRSKFIKIIPRVAIFLLQSY